MWPQAPRITYQILPDITNVCGCASLNSSYLFYIRTCIYFRFELDWGLLLLLTMWPSTPDVMLLNAEENSKRSLKYRQTVISTWGSDSPRTGATMSLLSYKCTYSGKSSNYNHKMANLGFPWGSSWIQVLFNCKSPWVNLRLSSIKPLSYLLPSFLPFCVPTESVFLLIRSRSPRCYTAVSFLPSVQHILMVVLTIPSQLQALVLPLFSLRFFLQDVCSLWVFHMP